MNTSIYFKQTKKIIILMSEHLQFFKNFLGEHL